MKKVDTAHNFNSAMIGMILADGSMPKENYLYLRHGGKQLNYVDEKVEYLSNYLQPSSVRSAFDKKGYEYRYAFYNSDKLKYLYRNIYAGENGKKVLKTNIINRMDAISLAFIYMDDGCLSLRKDPKYEDVYKSREIHLNVQSFTMSEVQQLKAHILKKFDVDFHITTDKGKPRMWCNTSNTIKFLTVVAPIVKEFPSMLYKLDLKYKKKNIKFI